MTRQAVRDPFRGRDPREIPTYNAFDAAHYLRIPENTIRNWAFGYRYPSRGGRARATTPLIDVADWLGHRFSFHNLVELHVLGALRREHRVDMKIIRRTMDYLRQKLNAQRPLITEEMETDGVSIFVTRLDEFINASREGQLAMRALFHARLKRIDRDAGGIASRLFPFTCHIDDRDSTVMKGDLPRLVSIDPTVAFGRPVIAGSRVPTIEVYQRFSAGESPDELAADFGRTPQEIWEAIRCESAPA